MSASSKYGRGKDDNCGIENNKGNLVNIKNS